jgi:putative transposase
MQRFQSYRFVLRPTGNQRQQMCKIAGCCRFVFNRALAIQMERGSLGEAELDYESLCQRMIEWRRAPESNWLAEAPVGALQQALRNLERAFVRYRARQARYPTFKRKARSDSFRCSNLGGLKLKQTRDRILIPGFGSLRYRNSREVSGQIRNVTVSRTCDKWFVSILTERQVQRPVARAAAVGIDMGIVRFATLSDGSFYAPLNSFRRHEKALAVAQRSLSRKTKYSNNWRKQKAKVQRVYARIANARSDYLHKISTTISQNYGVVCVEHLRVSAMSRSGLTASDSRSASVSAKRGLNKSILDQGWFEFRRQLAYKLAWQGGRLIAVSPSNTSITCPNCKHVNHRNRTSQSEFRCVACGFEENADVVGAVNVLRAGHARLACAETSPAYEASGQEPTDAFSHDSSRE